MRDAPCDKCGYNGPNYYQPNVHPCAAPATTIEQMSVLPWQLDNGEALYCDTLAGGPLPPERVYLTHRRADGVEVRSMYVRTDTAPAPDEATVRAEFEAWALAWTTEETLSRTYTGNCADVHYLNQRVEDRWQGYRTARGLK